jgi:NAD-dependent SIR2 family protein deacetylase
MLKKINSNTQLLDFNEFKKLDFDNDFPKIIKYFSGVSLQRDCMRWQALNSFHFVLMAFINEYGYDFQVTSTKQFKKLTDDLPTNIITQNVDTFVKRSGLEKSKQLKAALNCLKRV